MSAVARARGVFGKNDVVKLRGRPAFIIQFVIQAVGGGGTAGRTGWREKCGLRCLDAGREDGLFREITERTYVSL